MPVRVLIADDHPIVRRGLYGLLAAEPDVDVVGQATNGMEAMALARECQPDVILMDLHMPVLDGVEAIRRIRAENRVVQFIVLTSYDNDEWLFDGIRAGARGYLLKDAEPEELTAAIRMVARGESLVEPAAATRLLDRFSELSAREATGELVAPTQRELDILRLLMGGASNREIASQLLISEKTVKTHVAHLFHKLAARNRVEAVAEAARRGWIKL